MSGLLPPQSLSVASASLPTAPKPAAMSVTQQVSKKRKFVADGVFRAELDEFLRRELGEDGYAGCVRTPSSLSPRRPHPPCGVAGCRWAELIRRGLLVSAARQAGGAASVWLSSGGSRWGARCAARPAVSQRLTIALSFFSARSVEVRDTPMRMEVVIRATQTANVLGEKGRRIRELTSAVQKRCVNAPLVAFP